MADGAQQAFERLADPRVVIYDDDGRQRRHRSRSLSGGAAEEPRRLGKRQSLNWNILKSYSRRRKVFPWPRLADVQPPALSQQCRLNQSIIAERPILSYLSGMLLSNPSSMARIAARSFSRKSAMQEVRCRKQIPKSRSSTMTSRCARQ